MKLKDQGFEVGDKVAIVYSLSRVCVGTVVSIRQHQPKEEVLIRYAPLEHTTGDLKGVLYGKEPDTPSFFHRDAVTFDEHGRLTAINHDYVKPRAPNSLATKTV